MIFLFISGCRTEDDNEKSKLIVAVSADNPPYEFIQDQKIVGIDIDIINMIANKLNRKIEIKNMDFDGIIPALQNATVDMAIAGITPTLQRKENIDFSIKYLDSKVSILTRSNSSIESENDLKNKIIGAQAGTTWYLYAKNLVALEPSIDIRILSNNLLLIESLMNNTMDAIVIEDLQSEEFIKKYPGTLRSFVVSSGSSSYAIAFPKGSKLVDKVNKVILELEKNNEFDNTRTHWIQNSENK